MTTLSSYDNTKTKARGRGDLLLFCGQIIANLRIQCLVHLIPASLRSSVFPNNVDGLTRGKVWVCLCPPRCIPSDCWDYLVTQFHWHKLGYSGSWGQSLKIALCICFINKLCGRLTFFFPKELFLKTSIRVTGCGFQGWNTGHRGICLSGIPRLAPKSLGDPSAFSLLFYPIPGRSSGNVVPSDGIIAQTTAHLDEDLQCPLLTSCLKQAF